MVSLSPGFRNIRATEQRLIQATAANLGGMLVREDFTDEVEEIFRRETVFWQLITSKRPAKAATIKKIREGLLPNVGFINRANLGSSDFQALRNTLPSTQADLSDPGQDLKALGGSIQASHFERSLQKQQGYPYGDTFAQETKDLLVAMARHLEMSLFVGDADANFLEFNGLHKQMNPANDHLVEIDTTSAEPDSIVDTLIRTIVKAKTDRTILRNITHIWCTGAGALQIQEEIGKVKYYENEEEIIPGIKVPAIQTGMGRVPIMTSPYINDLNGGAGNDVCRFYLVDMSTIEWFGLFPYGGSQSYDPQIFDITQFVNDVPLAEERMALMYGTLYLKNRGEGVFRVDVQVPSNTVWNISGS